MTCTGCSKTVLPPDPLPDGNNSCATCLLSFCDTCISLSDDKKLCVFCAIKEHKACRVCGRNINEDHEKCAHCSLGMCPDCEYKNCTNLCEFCGTSIFNVDDTKDFECDCGDCDLSWIPGKGIFCKNDTSPAKGRKGLRTAKASRSYIKMTAPMLTPSATGFCDGRRMMEIIDPRPRSNKGKPLILAPIEHCKKYLALLCEDEFLSYDPDAQPFTNYVERDNYESRVSKAYPAYIIANFNRKELINNLTNCLDNVSDPLLSAVNMDPIIGLGTKQNAAVDATPTTPPSTEKQRACCDNLPCGVPEGDIFYDGQARLISQKRKSRRSPDKLYLCATFAAHRLRICPESCDEQCGLVHDPLVVDEVLSAMIEPWLDNGSSFEALFEWIDAHIVNLTISDTFDLRARKNSFAAGNESKLDRFFPPWNIRLHAYSHFVHNGKPIYGPERNQLRAADLIFYRSLCDTFGVALKDRDSSRLNLFSQEDPLPHQAACDCDGYIKDLANKLYHDPAFLKEEESWMLFVNKIANWLTEPGLPSMMKCLGATSILPFHLAKDDQNPYSEASTFVAGCPPYAKVRKLALKLLFEPIAQCLKELVELCDDEYRNLVNKWTDDIVEHHPLITDNKYGPLVHAAVYVAANLPVFVIDKILKCRLHKIRFCVQVITISIPTSPACFSARTFHSPPGRNAKMDFFPLDKHKIEDDTKMVHWMGDLVAQPKRNINCYFCHEVAAHFLYIIRARLGKDVRHLQFAPGIPEGADTGFPPAATDAPTTTEDSPPKRSVSVSYHSNHKAQVNAPDHRDRAATWSTAEWKSQDAGSSWGYGLSSKDDDPWDKRNDPWSSFTSSNGHQQDTYDGYGGKSRRNSWDYFDASKKDNSSQYYDKDDAQYQDRWYQSDDLDKHTSWTNFKDDNRYHRSSSSSSQPAYTAPSSDDFLSTISELHKAFHSGQLSSETTKELKDLLSKSTSS